MNKDLTVALYGAINNSDQPRDINNWHCSSIGKCPRALYFERKQVGELTLNRPGGGKKLRWRSGHAIEATLRPELTKIYPKLLTNVRFTNEALDLTGEFDAYDPDSKTLISVKSVHDFAMVTKDGVTGLKEKSGTNARGNNSYKLKTGPYIHHEWQEHAYVLLTKTQGTTVDPIKFNDAVFKVEQITYIYITLGGLIACYTTPVNPEILQRVAAKVSYLNKCWASGELPMCLCREGQEMFQVTDQWCSYRTDKDCCNSGLLVV